MQAKKRAHGPSSAQDFRRICEVDGFATLDPVVAGGRKNLQKAHPVVEPVCDNNDVWKWRDVVVTHIFGSYSTCMGTK